MLSFGEAPFLECSSKGEKRLSAFYARIRWRGNKSIEQLYQNLKQFEGGLGGLPLKEAKGRKPINIEQCRSFYRQLWQEYLQENPDLLDLIKAYRGFTDIFGQAGRACQAEEVYLIWKGL